MTIHVSIPIGHSLVVNLVYRSCVVTFIGHATWLDLIILDMADLDVILGLDWLASYYKVLDCFS